MRLDLIPLFLLNPPSRLQALGSTLVRGAAFLFLIGAITQVATAAMSGVLSHAGGAPRVMSLAQLVPDLPTWWIPESPIGYVLCTAILVIGFALNSLGCKVQRLMY